MRKPNVRVESMNPPMPAETVPGRREFTRLQSGRQFVCEFEADPGKRVITAAADLVIFKASRRYSGIGCEFQLSAPAPGASRDGGLDGHFLRMVSTLDDAVRVSGIFRRALFTDPEQPGLFGDAIAFNGPGSVELMAHGGKWIIVGFCGAIVPLR